MIRGTSLFLFENRDETGVSQVKELETPVFIISARKKKRKEEQQPGQKFEQEGQVIIIRQKRNISAFDRTTTREKVELRSTPSYESSRA